MKNWINSIIKTEKITRQTEKQINLPLAVCAILLEAAEIDEQITHTEQQIILKSLKQHFQIDTQLAQDIIQQAKQEMEKQSDLWPFTHTLSQHLDQSQKKEILIMIWKVLFADNRLDPHERLLVRRLQSMLVVNHSLMMETKRIAKSTTQPAL